MRGEKDKVHQLKKVFYSQALDCLKGLQTRSIDFAFLLEMQGWIVFFMKINLLIAPMSMPLDEKKNKNGEMLTMVTICCLQNYGRDV